MPAPQIGDVPLGHGPRLERGDGVRRHREVRGAHGDLSAQLVRGVHPVVGQLDASQAAPGVDGIGDPGQGREVLIVPDPQLDERRDVRGGVDLDLLGADHRPATLGLDLAHGRLGARVAVAHAIAVGHLVEAVLGRERPDLDRFEEDVVGRVHRMAFQTGRCPS